MKKELNIANILKDKPKGTKLYADAFGKLSFKYITPICSIYTENKTYMHYTFYNDGKFTKDGEPILVPSKKMRDWSKFAWKQGDILVSNDGKSHVIFSRWYDDNYIAFYGKHYLNNENKDKAFYCEVFVCTTKMYSLEDKNAAKVYINAIEERLGGKLNLKTLEIEKTQLEFKDGDILSVPSTSLPKNHIFIFSKFNKYKDFECHVALTASGEITIPTSHGAWCRKDSGVKYAIEEEKQQLFEALAKKNKAWDTEKKAIVDLKPKCEFKPFDRCIWKIRNCEGSIWQASFVSYVDEYGATPMGVSIDEDLVNLIILPYNKETAKLIGTTDNWEGNNN